MNELSIITAQITKETWSIPRSTDTYRALYRQSTTACMEQGLTGMDALLIAAHVLRSIGIHIPSAMEKSDL